MRIKTLLWLIAIAVCVALGLWQRDNLSVLLREYISVRRDLEYTKGYPKLCKPVIRSGIAQIDPEAAAVVELTTEDGNSCDNLKFLADSSLKFPNNRFFLYGIAKISLRDYYLGLDPQIPIAIARRLAQVEPNNATYHYLAAGAMLMSRRGNDLKDVLAEIEQANRCSEYRCPYDDYKQQADRIVEKAKLSKVLMKQFSWSEQWQFRNRLLWWNLLQYANALFTDNDYPNAMRITDDVKRAFDRLEIRRFSSSVSYVGSLLSMFGQRRSPEAVELQRATISKERARENRLRLCSLLARAIEDERQILQPVQQSQPRISGRTLAIATILSVYLVNMLPALAAALLVILAFCLIFGFGRQGSMTVGSFILFAIGSVVFFFVSRGISFISQFSQFEHCQELYGIFMPLRINMENIRNSVVPTILFFAAAPVVWFILWIMNFIRPVKGRFWRRWRVKIICSVIIAAILTILFLVVFADRKYITLQILIPAAILFFLFTIVVWTLIMFGWWLYSCRLVRIILIAFFFAVLTFPVDSYLCVNYIPAIIFALIASVIATRTRMGSAWLLSVFSVFCWVTLTALSPLCAQYINMYVGSHEIAEQKSAAFASDQAAYEFVLTEFDSQKLTKERFRSLIGVVMPEDIERILRSAKAREFPLDRPMEPSFLRRNASPEEITAIAEEKQRQKKLTDLDLYYLIQGCGRDVTKIIAGFLDDPNNQWALISSARLGDISAKRPLEELLKLRLQANPNLDDINDYGDMVRRWPDSRGRHTLSRADSNLRDSRNMIRYYPPYLRSPNASEMIAALAPVSEPNEAASRYLDYIQRRSVCDLLIDRWFFNDVVLLPTSQARQVIKAYLAKASDWQRTGPAICREGTRHISPDSICSPIRELTGIYGDREIAESIFIMLQGTENDDWFDNLQIWPHLTLESAELIKKGLGSDNDKFRAWSVWQLRNVGYKFSPDEIDKLLKDDSWIVRANAVMAQPQRAKEVIASDKNSFVRFVATRLCRNY